MVDYNDNYDHELLEKVAKKCPEFESAYDSPFSNAGSLISAQDGLGDRVCNECTHWNQGHCNIFLKYNDNYQQDN